MSELHSDRVAFFGGSFDPPHAGHLAVARAARAALGLEAVLFAPVGAQPLKPAGATASFEDRLAMTRLAIAGEAGFEISLADAPRPGSRPNYTLETLIALRAGMPEEEGLFCLMGADSFAGLRLWHGAAQIPFVAPLVVASRPGGHLERLNEALPEGLVMELSGGQTDTTTGIEIVRYRVLNAEGESSPFYVLPGLYVDISASEVRQQLSGARSGSRPGGAALPKPVLEYIQAHGLYL